MQTITTAQLLAEGRTRHEISRLCKEGLLVRLAQGHYLRGQDTDVRRNDIATRRARHMALAATRRHPLALESAALVHGLPVATIPDRVQTVTHGSGRTRFRPHEVLHSGLLPDDHLTVIDGITVTTQARTVVDLARLRGLEPGLIPWDAAKWAARLDRRLVIFDDACDAVIAALGGRTGIARAKVARGLSSALSESPAETRSLHQIRSLGFAEPVQQYRVVDDGGRVLGFADFGWPDEGVLGEYDGQDKYAALARPGETPADVVRREKRRQESMEARGWVIARWGKVELARPERLRTRLESAFEIAAGRAKLRPTG